MVALKYLNGQAGERVWRVDSVELAEKLTTYYDQFKAVTKTKRDQTTQLLFLSGQVDVDVDVDTSFL